MEGNPAEGHRARLRKRWLEAAGKREAFAEHELLELLLSYAILRRDTKPLAKRLLARFGNLHGLLHAEQAALQGEDGVGDAVAVLIGLARELSIHAWAPSPTAPVHCNRPEDAAAFFQRWIGARPEERFAVLLLDQQNRVLACEELEHGTENRAQVYIKKLVRLALDRRATGLICAHNHPSGRMEWSPQDLELTRRIRAALEPLEIRLLDHLLLTREGALSDTQGGRLNLPPI